MVIQIKQYMKTKVICFIDSLNGGGAQKQIILLANGLSEKYDVSILYYHNLNFLKSTTYLFSCAFFLTLN